MEKETTFVSGEINEIFLKDLYKSDKQLNYAISKSPCSALQDDLLI